MLRIKHTDHCSNPCQEHVRLCRTEPDPVPAELLLVLLGEKSKWGGISQTVGPDRLVFATLFYLFQQLMAIVQSMA